MKKSIFILVTCHMILAACVFNSCQDSQINSDVAEAKEAKQDIKIAPLDTNATALRMSKDGEWKIFQSEAEIKINNNIIRCTELRKKMSNSSQKFDALHPKRIADLEHDNKALKERLTAFNRQQDTQEAFMYKFNHDMNELRQALHDLEKIN